MRKSDRSDDEAAILYSVLKDFLFFKRFLSSDDLESDAAIYLCKNLKYEYFPANTPIFKQGDESNGKMYLVYSGICHVILQQGDIITNMNLDDRKAISSTSAFGDPLTPRDAESD